MPNYLPFVPSISELISFSGSENCVFLSNPNIGGTFNHMPTITNATIAATGATNSSPQPFIISTGTTDNELKVNDIVIFTSTSLPSALTTGVPYFVASDGLTPGTFKISQTENGDVISSTDPSSFTVSVDRVFISYSTKLGLADFSISNSQITVTGLSSLETGDIITFSGSTGNIIAGAAYFVTKYATYIEIRTTKAGPAIFPDKTQTNIPVNKLTFIDKVLTVAATGKGNGCWARKIDIGLSVRWFGAAGDGITDDSTAINTAIACANRRASGIGAKVWLPIGVYAVSSPIIQRNGVQIEGEVGQAAQATNTTQIQKMAQLIAITPMTYMFTNEINGLRSTQTGLESKSAKSYSNSNVTNVFFNGNYNVQWCIYWFECWNGTFSNLRVMNSLSYGVLIFDSNQQIINGCTITGLLMDSVADGIFNNNTFVGTANFSAISMRGSNFNTINGNLIYFGLANDSSKIKKVASWTAANKTFTIADENANELPKDPQWYRDLTIEGESFTWDVKNQIISYTTVNVGNPSIRKILNTLPTNGVLIKSNSYQITGDVRLKQNSTSASANIYFGTSANTKLYVTQAINRATNDTDWTPITANSFVFNSTNTNPLVISLDQPPNSGLNNTDYWEFRNIKVIFDAEPNYLSKDPYLFVVDDNGELQSPLNGSKGLSLGATYFVKFWDSKTFSLASSRLNYVNQSWLEIDTGDFQIPYNLSISPAQGVITLTDAASSNAITGNKIEDVQSNAISMRSAYGNVFSGNTIMKARLKNKVTLVRVEAGSMDNQFTGNTIYRRLVTTTDKTDRCIFIDKVSYRNHFSGIRSGNARGIDIVDNYIGTLESSNKFDAQTLDNALVYKAKPVDYTASKGVKTIKNGLTKQLTTGPIIQDLEYTLFFKDVVFNDDFVGIIFSQGDSSTNCLAFIRDENGKTAVSLNGGSSTALSKTNLYANRAYDIAVVNMPTGVLIYIDGKDDTISYDVHDHPVVVLNPPATTNNTFFVLGNGFAAQTGSITIGKLRYYSDSLTSAEVGTLSINGRFEQMKWNTSNIAVDGNFVFAKSQLPTTLTQKTFSSIGEFSIGDSPLLNAGSEGELTLPGRAVLSASGLTSGIKTHKVKGLSSNAVGIIKFVNSANMYVELSPGSVPFTKEQVEDEDSGTFPLTQYTVTAVTNSSGLAQTLIDRNSTYRVSLWAKSSDISKLTSISIARDSNYTEVRNFGNNQTYEKFVVYLPPAWLSQTNLLNSSSIRLRGLFEDTTGSETLYTNPQSGDLTITRFRIDKNGPPLEAAFDFSAGSTVSSFSNENPNSTMTLVSTNAGSTTFSTLGYFLSGETITQPGGTAAVIVKGGQGAASSFTLDSNSIVGTFKTYDGTSLTVITGATSGRTGRLNPNSLIKSVAIDKITSKIQGAELPYTETVTWSNSGVVVQAGTADANSSYEWSQIDRLVTLNITLKYSTSIQGINAVSCPLPSNVPLPALRLGFSTGSLLYNGVGSFAPSATGATTPANIDLIVAGTSSTIQGTISTAGNYSIFKATVVYWAGA